MSCRRNLAAATAALFSGASFGGAAWLLSVAAQSRSASHNLIGAALEGAPPARPEFTSHFETSVLTLPRVAAEADFEAAMFVPNGLGRSSYGLFFETRPDEPIGAISALQVAPESELPCSNSFTLENRRVYRDYLERLGRYVRQDGDEPVGFPGFPVRSGVSGPDQDGAWTYDSELDLVVHLDGSNGSACRTPIQELNLHLAQTARVGDRHPHAVEPRWETGFDLQPVPLRRPPSFFNAEFSMPDPTAQHDLGIDFSSTPSTPMLASSRLHVLPAEQLDCPNEFATHNRRVYVDYVDAMAQCETLGDFCYPDVPVLRGLASTFDTNLDRVASADGSEGKPCQTRMQQEDRQRMADFTRSSDEYDAVQLRVRDERLRLAAGEASTAAYVALAVGAISFIGSAAAIRRFACARSVTPDNAPEAGVSIELQEAGAAP